MKVEGMFKSFDRAVAVAVGLVGLGPLEDVLDVAADISDGPLAVVDLDEGEDHDDHFEYEDDDADEDGEAGEACLLVVEGAPDDRPVDDPDEVDEAADGHEVPDACLLLDVGVVPEEEDEGEEGQVVVRPLEVGQQGQHYHRHEQLVNVLDHELFKFFIRNNPSTTAYTFPAFKDRLIVLSVPPFLLLEFCLCGREVEMLIG